MQQSPLCYYNTKVDTSEVIYYFLKCQLIDNSCVMISFVETKRRKPIRSMRLKPITPYCKPLSAAKTRAIIIHLSEKTPADVRLIYLNRTTIFKGDLF